MVGLALVALSVKLGLRALACCNSAGLPLMFLQVLGNPTEPLKSCCELWNWCFVHAFVNPFMNWSIDSLLLFHWPSWCSIDPLIKWIIASYTHRGAWWLIYIIAFRPVDSLTRIHWIPFIHSVGYRKANIAQNAQYPESIGSIIPSCRKRYLNKYVMLYSTV